MLSGSFRCPLRELHSTDTQVTGYQPLIWVSVLRPLLPPKRQSFILDSGASVPVMSLALAEEMELPIPGPESEIVLAYKSADIAIPVPCRVRPGRLQIQIPEIRAEPFDWPCYFRPDLARTVLPLLGLGGVLEDLRLTLDGVRSRNGIFFGYLLLEVRPPAATAISPV